ncbi:MAG: hypothetical protein ACKO7A_03665, partial [Microcystis sp.]
NTHLKTFRLIDNVAPTLGNAINVLLRRIRPMYKKFSVLIAAYLTSPSFSFLLSEARRWFVVSGIVMIVVEN